MTRGDFGDSIAKNIAEFIEKVGVDNRLPPERTMAEQLGVSRVALRDRLQSFEALGFLERRQGAGTFVRPLDPAGLAFMLDVLLTISHVSLEDLHVVRIALERQSAVRAASLHDIDFEEMERCIQVMNSQAKRSEVTAADAMFHDNLLRIADSPALGFFADALHSVLRRSLTYRNQRWARMVSNRKVLADVHLEILRAIKSGDSVRAAAAIDAHFSTFDVLTKHHHG